MGKRMFLISLLSELNSAYKTYHTRTNGILFFEKNVCLLTYSILAYAYPRALHHSSNSFQDIVINVWDAHMEAQMAFKTIVQYKIPRTTCSFVKWMLPI